MNKNNEKTTLPLMALYGFLPGVGVNDARAYVDSLVERHLSEYSADICYFDLAKWRDGYAYELKAGGDGLSDIRSILRFLDESPRGTKIYLDSATRQAEIFIRAEGDERFMFRLLQEGVSRHPAVDMGARQKAKLLVPTHRNLLGAGFSFAAMGVVFLAAAVMSMQLITSNNESVEMQKTRDRIVDLPTWHSPATVHLNPGQYLGKIQYENGRWLPPLILCGNEECKHPNAPMIKLGVNLGLPGVPANTPANSMGHNSVMEGQANQPSGGINLNNQRTERPAGQRIESQNPAQNPAQNPDMGAIK